MSSEDYRFNLAPIVPAMTEDVGEEPEDVGEEPEEARESRGIGPHLDSAPHGVSPAPATPHRALDAASSREEWPHLSAALRELQALACPWCRVVGGHSPRCSELFVLPRETPRSY